MYRVAVLIPDDATTGASGRAIGVSLKPGVCRDPIPQDWLLPLGKCLVADAEIFKEQTS
jgi:hypothetical protein